jgi:hypothetical protein
LAIALLVSMNPFAPVSESRFVFLLVFLVNLAGITEAHDLSDADFSLRFPAATSRFASYADVAAMGGAQAASEWSSSSNPASATWPHDGRKYADSFSPQFSALRFDKGTNLNVYSEALTLDAKGWGVFLPAAAQIHSNHEVDRNGLGFKYDAYYYQMQWGKMIAKNWAIGANFNLTHSDVRYDFADIGIARSRGETYDFRLGVINQVLPRLRAGFVFDYSFSPTITDFYNPLGPGSATLQSKDTTHEFLVRPGIVWEYSKGSSLYLDYQGGFFSNRTGALWVNRFPIGIEQMVIKDILYLRAGATFDTTNQVSPTAGLGLTLGDRGSIDLAYQYNMFPEIRSEFQTAQSFVLSLGIGF